MLKIKYNDLLVPGIKDILQNVSLACAQLDIDFFLVGAVARNIWYIRNGKEASGTNDVDFGIYVADQETYFELKAKLIKDFNYTESGENIFGLNTKEEMRIDLLPFGDIAEEGMITLQGKIKTQIKLDGFVESYKFGNTPSKIESDIYPTCSIPGIVILKLISYDDRPDRRIKDIKDLASIFKYYPYIEINALYEDHLDLFANQNEEFTDIGHVILGREMNKIIVTNSKLRSRIIEILKNAMNLKSDIPQHLIMNHLSETIDDKINILKNIYKGITQS